MTFFANFRRIVSRNSRFTSLVFCWLFGLIVGYCLLEPFFLPLMRSFALQPVSIVGYLVSLFLPFICSYVAIISDKPIIIMVVCFLKAVAFGFTGALISQFFYSASWLVRLLLMFSDSWFLIILFILWFRRFSDFNIHGSMDILVTALLGIGISIADFFWISPIVFRLF